MQKSLNPFYVVVCSLDSGRGRRVDLRGEGRGRDHLARLDAVVVAPVLALLARLLPGFRGSGFEIRVSGFGFGVWGFEIRVSGFGFRNSCFGFRVSKFVFRGSGFGFCVSGFGCRVSGFMFRVSGLVFPVSRHPAAASAPPPPRCPRRSCCLPGRVHRPGCRV